MPSRLQTYQRKRDFSRTSEPRGQVGRARRAGAYLIQKHAARRLHYDFRLELDGVLKSWAVPKGPSLSPHERRLAVHVEDHPLDYGSFEGVIPKPGYGAGSVMLWDRGEWDPVGDPREGYRKGNLKFILRGERLKGRWVLVRMNSRDGEGDKNWLLIKEGSEGGRAREPVEAFSTSVVSGRTMEQITAKPGRLWKSDREEGGERPPPPAPEEGRPAPLPRSFHPQLATLVDRAPSGDGWVHEVKFDGYRILCFVEKGKARLVTRNGLDWTARMPSVARAAETLKARSALLDGEVVVQKEDGTTDFQLLQNALREGRERPLSYMAFDLPFLDGRDLTGLPLLQRKEVLKALLERGGNGVIRYSGHLAGQGREVFRSACGHALEGLISKRADAPYVQRRTSDWVKVKCMKEQEFVIGGYTAPKGNRRGFGSLLIGTYDDRGRLVYNGHVGTGFSEKTLDQLGADLARHERKDSPFAAPVEDKLRRQVRWVDPVLVCQVSFIGWTEEGYCRHPSFMGLRQDKKPREVHVEKTQTLEEAAPPRKKTGGKKSEDGSEAVAGVRLSHPGRVLYPGQGITKRDLARYYEAVAPRMLPHLRGRPVVLVRCPEGQDQGCFYQKHPVDAPLEMRRIAIQEKEKTGDYLLIDDARGLVTAAQMGALELHLWGSTEDSLEKPDRLVFDLDPAPDVPWPRTVRAARRIRERLSALGLESFVNTTGGKGLHVVAPIVPDLGWDAIKAFAKAMAAAVEEAHPGEYVIKSTKALRGGKIFIDYLRNGRGATFVCPFSPRASGDAPVSVPLRWEELSSESRPGPFTVTSVPARLARLKKDPWEGFFQLKQRLPADVRRSLLNV